MGEALWTGLEILAFCLLVSGVVGLAGAWWGIEAAGLLLVALVVWRAVRAEAGK